MPHAKVICFKAQISFFQNLALLLTRYWEDGGVGGIEFGGVGSPSVSVERHELVP